MGVMCQILIDKPRDGVHRAGGIVSGCVKYAVDEPTELKDIIISLIGRGHCIWASLKKSKSFSNTYMGTQDYVEDNVSIFYKPLGEETSILPVGSYENTFLFTLPENIPPSFKNRTCVIYYRIRLKFEKNSFFGHKRFIAPIQVKGFVRPGIYEGSEEFKLDRTLIRFFSDKTQINITGEISKTLIAPGEYVDVSFAVNNDTDVVITSIRLELMCYTTYTADCDGTKNQCDVFKESTVDTVNVPANSAAKLASTMRIPENLPSIQYSKILSKQYKVKVTLVLPLPHYNVSVEVPVVIGVKREDDPVEAPFDLNKPGPSVEGEGVSEDGPPPSYWEVMKEDEEHE